MINLLPPLRQKKLQLEEMAKIVAILGIAAIAALCVFVLALLLVRNLYSFQLKAAEIILVEKEQEMKIYGVQNIENQIDASGKLISRISGFGAQQTKIADMFLQTAAALPPRIYLTEFGYNSKRINLEGFAPDRDSLVVLRNNLEKQRNFSKIVFPSETWLVANNINFSVNFQYAKSHQ
jgi:Tfp pilus assembly protein PilN